MRQAYRLIDLITQALETSDFCGVVGFCSNETFPQETVRMFASCEWVLASSKVFEGTHSLAYSPSGTAQAPGGWPVLREVTSRMLDKIYASVRGRLLASERSLTLNNVAVINPPFTVRKWLVVFLNARKEGLKFELVETLDRDNKWRSGPLMVTKVPVEESPDPEVSPRTRYIRADRQKVLRIFAIGLGCDDPILEAISLA